ncbi:cytochrome c-type biogenesis protein CcmH [Dehalococcoidia bacterium]|nr:cytochrome c-type biogenesis protein CcmH [Dehalococcoidia bacterium]
MGLLCATLLLAIGFAASTFFVETTRAADPNVNVRSIAQKLQCPVCDGTSVADSASQVANDMKHVIAKRLAAGESEDDIISYFIESYGTGVLRQPPTHGFHSAVWWVPGLAILAGAIIIYITVIKRPSALNYGADRDKRTSTAQTKVKAESEHDLKRVRKLVRRNR